MQVTTCTADARVVEGRTVGAVAIRVHLKRRWVESRGVADAEHLGSTVIASARRPRILRERIRNELPTWNATKVRATTEDHHQVIRGHQTWVGFSQIFEVTDILAGLVIALHELEAGFAVGFRRPCVL